MLTIAPGSVHGLKDKSVSLDLERLQAIRARLRFVGANGKAECPMLNAKAP